MDEARPFLTVLEVARILDRSRERTYQLAAAGQIPSVKIGGQVRVPRRAFEQWLDALNTRALARVVDGHRHSPDPAPTAA